MEPFVHEALLYHDHERFLAVTVPFITAGLDSDEPVLVATVPANLARLRDTLPGLASQVWMTDMTEAGRNPGRILPAVLLAFAEEHRGRRVRILGEPIWPGRDALEYPACVQHEALINAAFAARDARILCPYDVAGLDPRAIEDAERTHPVLTTTAGQLPSPRYADPVRTADSYNLPLPPPPPTAVRNPVTLSGLADLRQQVIGQATAAGLRPDRIMDATIAINELASNTVDHSSGPGTLTSWRESGHLVWQITDHGHITDPLAGRLPVPPHALSGRGLVLVNQICDLVRIHTEPGHTTIRVHLGPTRPTAGPGGEAPPAGTATGAG